VSNPPESTTSILDGLPTNITTIGAAMSVWMERLRRRLDAKSCLVTVTTLNTTYVATLPGATVTMTISGGYFPLSVQYTRAQSTGSATFDNFPAALDWLVARLA
jgi:PKD repeat protein